MIYSFVVIGVFIVIYAYYRNRKNKKSHILRGYKEIPEEPGLPVIGVLGKVESPLCNYLTKLSKKHGPIYRIKLGMRDVIILNSFEYIKEAMVIRGEVFSGRWKAMKYIMVSNDAGVVFVDGEVWYEHRSFILRTLKDFGVGRSRSMDIVQNECLYLLKDIETLEGKVVHFPDFIPIYTVNVICKFIMNRRFKYGDEELRIIDDIMATVAKQKDPVSFVSLMFPCLEENPWIMKFIIWMSGRKSLFDESHVMLEGIIQDHLNHLDVHSEGEDLIERFLIKQHQLKEKQNQVNTFTNIQLVRNSLELLMAGYDATSTALVWCFMFMSRYPLVQDRIHQEILDQIGLERLPTMNDKKSLNYTQAVMDEILRVSSAFPLALFHRTVNDGCIDGHFIPRNTVTIANIFATHIDPNIWERPTEFYPEHFLIRDNKHEWKYNSRAELIAFGMGKRQCLGESLARMEIFIFFLSILQRFRVSFPNETTKEELYDIYQGTDGIARATELNDFIFKKRY